MTALLLLSVLGCRPAKEPAPETVAAAPEPSPVIRWRFGGEQSPSGRSARQLWVLLSETPEAERLRSQTLDKLARAPFQAWPARAATATNDFAPLFRQIFADLATAESFFEAHGDTNRFNELVLAVRLAPERAEFWQTNLLRAFSSWIGQPSASVAADPRGWQLALSHPRGQARLARAGNWTLLGWAAGNPARFERWRERLSVGEPPAGAASGAWLELVADLSGLPASTRTQWFGAILPGLPAPSAAPERLPTVRLTLGPRAETMRLDGELTFAGALAARLDEWQIPTELVRDPIVGITAVRGVAGFMKTCFEALGLPAESPPNQVFVWTGAAFPVQVLAAAPTPEAEKMLQSAAAVFPARFNGPLSVANAGTLELLTNAAGEVALRWTDIPPFITPFLTVATGSNHHTHLVAGLYPNWAFPESPSPTALFEHLGRATNLMYYEWEFTGPRAYSWRASLNIVRHLLGKPRLGAETAGVAFLNSLTNHPGNTVTEVRRVDTNRLTLVREGPFVLTGAELLWLAHWLESPEFPFRLRVPGPATDATP